MIRVIDRNPYDTEKAEQIAQFTPNTEAGSIHNARETLYKHGNNDYFLYTEQWDTANCYVINYDETEPSSESIVPVTDEEAVDWCENQGIDGKIIIEQFGHLIDW